MILSGGKNYDDHTYKDIYLVLLMCQKINLLLTGPMSIYLNASTV